MPEDKRLHAPGARRFFDALEAVPHLDADTDEELDLFVCDLLSNADKVEFEERIQRDPVLAAEVRRRKADIDAYLDPGQLSELTDQIVKAVFARVPGHPLGSVSEKSATGRSSRLPADKTRSVFGPGWKLPTWLPVAAAFVVFIAIAAVIVNRGAHKRESQDLVRGHAPSDATIIAAERSSPAMHESPAPNNAPDSLSDAMIVSTRLPTPAVHSSPADNNALSALVAAAGIAAITAPEILSNDDTTNAESDAAALEMFQRAAVIAEMYRSISGTHTQDATRTYSVSGVDGNDMLNVRSHPSEKSSIVARLRNGSSGIQIDRRTVQNSGDDWVPITAPGAKGWVRPKYLSPTGHVETPDEKRRRLAGRLGIALALKLGTRPAADDDSGDSLMKAFGTLAADALIESTVKEAFPDQPLVRQQVLMATKALFEGDLTLIATEEENRKQEMIAWLQRRSPSAAQNAEIIDFLYEVYQGGHSS